MHVLLSAWLALWVLSVGGAATAEQLPAQDDCHPQDSRDPFVPLLRHGERTYVNPEIPVLTGILWDPTGQALAVLDQMEMTVGDTIRGYHVTAIQPSAVVLSCKGRSLILQTHPEGMVNYPGNSQ